MARYPAPPRSPITDGHPGQIGRPFRRKSDTCSDPIRTPKRVKSDTITGQPQKCPISRRNRCPLWIVPGVRNESESLSDFDWNRCPITVGIRTLPSQTKTAVEAWLEIRGREAGPLVGTLDRLRKGKRLLRTSLYRLIENLGSAVGIKTRPHGLRHAAITAACERAQMQGMGLEEVLDFSRHAKGSVGILLVYRDRERNVQGKLASLVADAL